MYLKLECNFPVLLCIICATCPLLYASEVEYVLCFSEADVLFYFNKNTDNKEKDVSSTF